MLTATVTASGPRARPRSSYAIPAAARRRRQPRRGRATLSSRARARSVRGWPACMPAAAHWRRWPRWCGRSGRWAVAGNPSHWQLEVPSSAAAGVPRPGPGPTRFRARAPVRGQRAAAAAVAMPVLQVAAALGVRVAQPGLSGRRRLAATPVWRQLTSGLNLGRRLQLCRMPRQCAHRPSIIRTPSLAVPDHRIVSSLLEIQ